MQYDNLALKEYMLTFDMMDAEIDEMLMEYGLTREKNDFFRLTLTKPTFPLQAALRIGYNWREITKQFLFTVLTGLGVLSEKLSTYTSPPFPMMSVLQSGINVISDDLSNVFPTLNKIAPKGPAGAHYQWWEDTILNVVLAKGLKKKITIENTVSPGVKKLLHCMNELAKDPLGAAVQLRIVEAIALNIALTYRALYSRLEVDGQKVFPKTDDLAWVNAHIKAEVVHHRQVKDKECGMAHIAVTPEEQRKFLVLTKEYIECWAAALKDFKEFVSNDHPLKAVNDEFLSLTVAPEQNIEVSKKWRCVICDFIYDETLGLPEDGIAAGTRFEDIPDDWVCVDCGVTKDDFELMI